MKRSLIRTAMMSAEVASRPEATRPAFCSIDDWVALSGMGRRTTYEHLGTGDLKAVKVGTRTLIDVDAGLAWLRSQPAPAIRVSRNRAEAAV